MEELNEIKKQFDDLMEKAEEIIKKHKKDDESKRWRAEENKGYYYLTSHLKPSEWVDQRRPCDDECYKIGNYFQTEREAEKVAQHFKDYLILRADAKGFEPKDVSCESGYYYVYWGAIAKRFNTVNDVECLSGTIYFETREDAKASIEKHGDIWKRYLGVEE